MAAVSCAVCGLCPQGDEENCLECSTPLGTAPAPRTDGPRIGAADPDFVSGRPPPDQDQQPVEFQRTILDVDCRNCGGDTAPGRACVHCEVAEPGGPARFVLDLRPADTARQATTAAVRGVEGERIPLGRGTGHSPEIMAALNRYDFVSRGHAVIRLLRRQVEVTDLSSNGTWVGGERIARGDHRVFDAPVALNLGNECTVSIGLER